MSMNKMIRISTYDNFFVGIIDHSDEDIDKQNSCYYHVCPKVDFTKVLARAVR